MRLKDGFDIVEIAGDYMAVPVGKMAGHFNGTVILNEVSAFSLNQMKEDISKERLIYLLLGEYRVDKEILIKDVDHMVDALLDAGLIEE